MNIENILTLANIPENSILNEHKKHLFKIDNMHGTFSRREVGFLIHEEDFELINILNEFYNPVKVVAPNMQLKEKYNCSHVNTWYNQSIFVVIAEYSIGEQIIDCSDLELNKN
jgi:hypothetical protein